MVLATANPANSINWSIENSPVDINSWSNWKAALADNVLNGAVADMINDAEGILLNLNWGNVIVCGCIPIADRKSKKQPNKYMRIKIYQIGLIGDVDVDVATDADADDRIDFTFVTEDVVFVFIIIVMRNVVFRGKGGEGIKYLVRQNLLPPTV